MIVVTGGAGFIGSAIVWALNQRGISDILITDHLGSCEKWKNLVPLQYKEYLNQADFLVRLEKGVYGSEIEAILHMGACSATTETDADYLMSNNYRYTLSIGQWWEKHQSTRFIYASSAATYGDGDHGYIDDESKLETLRPLNMYGYSKHAFDLAARQRGWLDKIVGLKFFNVFGPNESHKGDMRSLVNKSYPKIRDEGTLTLFKSHRAEYGDGEQKRDFVYIKDTIAMTFFFLDNKDIGGLYNIGTGKAQSWNDLAKAMFDAMSKPLTIQYIPMPDHLKSKYQYFTEADLAKLRSAGCTHECLPLEVAVRDYIINYLEPSKLLGQ